MGEYVPTTIRFAGRITKAQANDLIVLLAEHSLTTEDGNANEPDLFNLDETFGNSEINYGNLDDIEQFCRAVGVAYEHWVDVCGGEPEDVRRWHPGMDGHNIAICANRNPMVEYSRLLEVENKITVFADLIHEAKFWLEPLGLLEIIP